jgi:hypothetical protein
MPTSQSYILDDIDESERIGLGTDMCTLMRLGINNMEAARANANCIHCANTFILSNLNGRHGSLPWRALRELP